MKHTLFAVILIWLTGCVSDNAAKLESDSTKYELDSLNEVAFELLRVNLDSCMSMAMEVELRSRNLSYAKGLSRSLSIQGNVMTERGLYDSAIKLHREALDIRRDAKIVQFIGRSYNNIGEVYGGMDDYGMAMKMSDSAYQIYKELGDFDLMSGAASNKAINFIRQDSIDSARYWFYRALSLVSKSNNSSKKLNATYNYANFLYRTGDTDSGAYYLDNALLIALEDSMYADLPGIYFSMGQNLIGINPVRARQLHDTALFMAREQELDPLEEKILKSKIELIEENDQLIDSIIPVYDELIEVIKSNYDEKRLQDFADFEVKYKTAEQVADNQRLKEVKKWLIFSLILVSVVFVLAYRSQVQKRKLTVQEHARKIDSLLKQEETRNIDAMIEFQESERTRIASDLHDRLGSILSAVKLNFASVREQLNRIDSDQKQRLTVVTGLIDEAATEVRRISHDMASSVLANFGLLHAVYDLKNALETSGKIKIEVFEHGMDKRLSSAQEINIYRIIQELVSNSLKHAKATQIDIHFTKEEEMLTVIVEDNGIGFPKEKRPNSGIGLANIEKRINDLDGSFTLDSNPKSGTTAIIELKT